MKGQTAHINLEVNDLANFLFIQNKNDAVIELNLGGIKNTFDLFCFLLNILCKGIVLMFSPDTMKFDIDSITSEQFAVATTKLANAGILCDVDVSSNSTNKTASVNFDSIDDNKTELKDHAAVITTADKILKITFRLKHIV